METFIRLIGITFMLKERHPSFLPFDEKDIDNHISFIVINNPFIYSISIKINGISSNV